MAQTLKFGNKTWATKVGSTLAYNDENGNYKPLPFAFTRSTSATRVNKEGLIEVVTNDRPRIDYTDTSDGVLLLEKAATNLIQYSEAFDNSYWAKTNLTITSNQVISPDGALNSDLLTPTASLGTHSIGTTPLINYNSQESTISFFAKFNGYNISLSLAGTPTNWTGCVFDLENGVARTPQNSGAQTICTSKIENYGNGWYRCSVTFTPYATGTFYTYWGVVDSVNVNLGSYGMQSYTANGTSGVYIYGAQSEAGNLSSYIPTQGSASTRVAETASGSGNSEVFNDSEGSLYMDFDVIEKTSSSYYIVSVRSSNGSNVLGVGGRQGKAFAEMFDGTNYISNNSANLVDGKNKIFLTYNSGSSAKLFLNGIKVLDFTGTIPTLSNLSELTQGDRFLGNKYYGNISEIGYYDAVLTDSELEYLTSYRSLNELVTELNLNTL